jgi:hypothetical protein
MFHIPAHKNVVAPAGQLHLVILRANPQVSAVDKAKWPATDYTGYGKIGREAMPRTAHDCLPGDGLRLGTQTGSLVITFYPVTNPSSERDHRDTGASRLCLGHPDRQRRLPTMTRKHYIAIAAALKTQRESYAPHWDANLFRALDDSCRAIAAVMREASALNRETGEPLFDTDRFLRACGVNVPLKVAA